MSSTALGHPKALPDLPVVCANPALDQMEMWTHACSMWNDCSKCQCFTRCHRTGDMLIDHLSDPHTKFRIRILISSTGGVSV